ncbi:type IV toxin-antitoxin system AbiEi family antitoxin domain-containing protein [Nocardioides albus]|uniref:Very-short-patch-repair endonuclease n=1 Tax=Nocardioides albus TaxID=1841 RepID=A0A7W5A123_9ACTN|nr:type IV toxin-antitoxin system AbiEi family antitoxin domain-containing protein [Nocardioides albus]MBB3087543.1 very-short-patch-repair endonuclease [Nocardioides albus]GGU09747.1 hypothetical protein GCM10007979_04660 [Nocardioides albus]
MDTDIDAERTARDLAARRMWAARELELQDGVASRAQLTWGGYSPNGIRRAIRRRELQPVHRGVYVTHTGPLTWRQRAWAAVLYAGPAALCGPSVLEPKLTDESHGPIHVAIDHTRRLDPPPGIVVHRVVGLSRQMFAGARPPRLKLEDNALLRARGATSEMEVIGLLADTIGRRGVTTNAVRTALKRHPRLSRRAFVIDLLADIDAGACSVLEHAYLIRVERAHGLPPGTRQSPRQTPNGREFRDVEYEAYGLVVELDGRLNHESWKAQGRDADRDLDDLARGGRATARLRWPQVYDTACRTAARVSQILKNRGWTGTPLPCGKGCDLATWEF